MISITTIGISLFTLPFIIIAVHALREYLKDKQNPQKKHVFYAFLCISIGFISALISASILSPDMSPEKKMIVNTLFKSFDAFNTIGAFWLFIFLIDFIKKWRKYTPFVVVHLAITLVLILLTPAGVIILNGDHIIDRADVRSLAILVFWFLYWGLIAYEFWKHSRLMTKKIAIGRSQTMTAGAVLAISAYVLVVLAQLFQELTIQIFAQICAVASGIVFYAGFVAPEWLRRRWEK